MVLVRFISYFNTMAAKKWTSRKKTVKNDEKIIEKTPEIEETTVSTVVENEISDAENESGIIVNAEREIGLKKSDLKAKKEESKVIWTIWWAEVNKPLWRIRFEAQVQAYPMFLLPEHIRRYLINNGFTSDIYKKDKEWLEKHNVDMEIVEDLKRFLTEKL